MTEHGACGVERTVRGARVVDGAGVRLARIIGSPQLDHVDPFVLLDEFRSDDPEDYRAGFPWHPHRGIETVTYLIRGQFRHEDSKGGGGLLTPGTVQWMTAGRGILHSEMPAVEAGQLWGYQLWLTLPRRDKLVAPRYQHLAADAMPRVGIDGGTVTVISGQFGQSEGPAQTWFPIGYFDVRLRAGGLFHQPVGLHDNRLLYVHSGTVTVDPRGRGQRVSQGDLVILGAGPEVVVKGATDSGFLYLAAQPLGEPIVKGGPFVMNTRAEIRQAFRDYEAGRLG